MTVLIKLTRVKEHWMNDDMDGTPIFVNPAHITKVHADVGKINNPTFVTFHDRAYCTVKETPEEIADLIFKAEHPECKL